MKTTRINVAEIRDVNLWGYDCKLNNNWEYGIDLKHMKGLIEFADETFSYSEVGYYYSGSVGIPQNTTSLADILRVMNLIQGNKGTNLNATVETLYMGISNCNDPYAAGIATMGKRALVVSTLSSFDYMSATISHEMGHCFGLWHTPSPGVDANNYLDTNYPYGGASMSGGWGYSILTGRFYAEDDHVVQRTGPYGYLQYNPHYEIMSYSNPKVKFSDYHVSKLKPNIQYPVHAPTPSLQDIPNIRFYPGTKTLVFGPESAKAMGTLGKNNSLAQSWMTSNATPAQVGQETPFFMDKAIQDILAGPGAKPSIIFTVIPEFDDLEIVY